MKAVYAVSTDQARGRQHREALPGPRTPWERDRDRVLHSVGFRSLQYKTQVYLNHEGDFFRTRLTHSLEVAQIARSVARQLRVDEDLAETLALVHDVGHTPFGHAGEHALAGALKCHGGFDHNIQSLRQVVKLEQKYMAFDGLNLTWETLEGLAKRHMPLKDPSPWLRELDAALDLQLGLFPSLEAQIAAQSDEIAYNAHDLDDALRFDLLTPSDVREIPLAARALAKIPCQPGDLTGARFSPRIRSELVRHLVDALVRDITQQTRQEIEALNPKSVEDIRRAPRWLAHLSDEMAAENRALKQFLRKKVYYHWKVRRMARKAEMVLREMFGIFNETPELLPDIWFERLENRLSRAGADTDACRARLIGDYLASMTDRCAVEEYGRLTDIRVVT